MKTATQLERLVATARPARAESGTIVSVWLGVAVLVVTQLLIGPSSIESIVLAAAPLIVVPLACDVLRAAISSRVIWQPPRRVAFFAASLAAVAIALTPGWQAALLALPWTLLTLSFAATNFFRWLKSRERSAHARIPIAAVLFLSVGGLWLFVSCAGAAPLGFGEPIVRLTAVHFHYAGFVLTAIAARVARWYERPAVNGALFTLVGGVPLVAIGIALRSPALELAATALLGSAAIALGILPFVTAVRSQITQALSLLGVSSISLSTAMVLAFLYALGRFQGEPVLDIPLMIATHGLLNAAGFSLFGLLGWRYIDRPE